VWLNSALSNTLSTEEKLVIEIFKVKKGIFSKERVYPFPDHDIGKRIGIDYFYSLVSFQGQCLPMVGLGIAP